MIPETLKTENIYEKQQITRTEFSPILIVNDGVGSRIIHTEQEIKIVVHCGLLPTDTLHHPAGQ